MKFSLNWLKDYVALAASNDEISRAITFLGFEVEGIVSTGAPRLEQVVVGEVLTRDRHPNADKLSVCTVDLGLAGGVKTIVCGAQNYKVGDRVPVALPGAVLPGNFTIRQSKIRGQLSDGMMCSPKELGLPDDVDGLLILPGRPALGAPINEVLAPGDTVFDVEITPNRPDCLSHLGLARELAAWFRLPLTYPQEKFRGVATGRERSDLLASVRVDAPEDCPLYTAHIITGVTIAPSPAWMQDRLRAVGLRPINNVVDIGNYVMLETGQPLHAFDARRLEGRQIVVRRAADGEKIRTLDDKERTLGGRMLVIADANRPVVVAGIMGGMDSGVAPDTTDLVLECAVFQRQSVRWTSKRLGVASDSSYRYERGVDAHAATEAAWRAIDLLLEHAGGQVAGPVHRVGGEIPWAREIVVTHDFIVDRLGFDIPAADMKASLEALELRVVREEPTEKRGTAWTVAVPSWRDDLDRPIDLVEEVLRLHGTERIPAGGVSFPAIVAEDAPIAVFNRRATDYLVGHDFHECANYTLRPAKELATWVSEAAAAELALANPFVDDQSHLRPTLITGLLESLKLNQSRGVAVSRLCETGRLFVEDGGQILECAGVGFIIAEDKSRRWKQRDGADFHTVKHHVSALAALAGVDLEEGPQGPAGGPYFGWQEGQSASAGGIGVRGGTGWTARFGLLNLGLVRSLGIDGKVYAGIFSILPEKLAARPARRRFSEFSLFPPALRDLALVVDQSTPAAEVRRTLRKLAADAGGTVVPVEAVEVFDVYQGAGLPEGKKSLAFSLAFRASDRTLTDAEVSGVFTKVQEAVERSTAFAIRR